MRYFWIMVLVLFQSYFLASVSGDWIPNLILIAVASALLCLDIAAGLKLALWAGFWLDVLANNTFGYRLGWLLTLTLIIYWLKHIGFKINRFSFAFGLVLGFSVFYNLGLWADLWIVGGQFNSVWRFAAQWLVEAVVTATLAYIAFDWLQSKWSTRQVRL